MNEEVQQLVGEKHQFQAQQRAYRWGQEDGYCVVDGQKVRMRRPRVRDPQQGEHFLTFRPNEETHCLKRRRVEQRASAGKRDAGQ
jgi:hypothetical protein